MKITQSNTLKISNKTAVFKLIRGMQKGASIPARIIARPSAKEAIIEINGKHIRAEFLKGVPGNNSLTLKLENFNKEQYVFSIVDQSSRKNFATSITEFTLLNENQLKNINIFNLNNFISKEMNNLFELNFFLINGFSKKKDRNENLLNKLLSAGIDKELLINFAYISASNKINLSLFYTLLSIFKRDKNYSFESKNKKSHEEKFDDLIDEIDNKLDESRKLIIIRQLIDYLSDIREGDDAILSGELFYPDEEDFKRAEYILHNDNLIISIELSVIGKIDIAFKMVSDRCVITFFSEEQVSGGNLKDFRENLFQRLSDNRLNFEIYFYDRRIVIDKIKEINTYYSLNSGFDIKI